jgi:signal transduction histidine kinase
VALQLLAPRTGHPATNDPAWVGPVSLALALGQGLPLAWRRLHPLAATGSVLVCYAASGVVVGLVPPYAAWVMIWSVATTAPDRRRSVRITAAVSAATCLLVLFAEQISPGTGAWGLLIGITVVVALFAVLVRSERARVEAVSQQSAAAERLRIARDLHDLVGHGLSTVAVQSSAARMALDAGQDATAKSALAAVESSSRTAMREMRALLGVLRDLSQAGAAGDENDAAEPTPGLDDIAPLVDNVRRGGVAVMSESEGEVSDVGPDIQLCAYRVVQEALTNAVKHAPGAVTTVRVGACDGLLQVSVETTGGTDAAVEQTDTGNLGLDGIRTRVAAAGGQTRIGPIHNGWLVEAQLPLTPEETR